MYLEIFYKISRSVGILYFTTKSEFMTKKCLRLTDRQWQVMENFLPVKTKGHYALRDLMDTILWILRTGSQ